MRGPATGQRRWAGPGASRIDGAPARRARRAGRRPAPGAPGARGRLRRRLALAALIAALTTAPAASAWERPERVATLTHPGDVWALAWSPDGKYLAAGGALHRAVVVWEAATGRQLRVLAEPAGGVTALAWSRDGRSLAAGRNFVRLVPGRIAINVWDTRSWANTLNLPGPFARNDGSNDVRSLAWSPDGRRLAAGWMGGMTIYALPSGSAAVTLTGKPSMGGAVAYDPGGRALAVAGDGDTRSVLLLDPGAGTILRALSSGSRDPVDAIGYSPDGELLAAGDWKGRAFLWEVGSGRVLRQLSGPGHRIESLSFSAGGEWIAAATGERAVQLWSVARPGVTVPVLPPAPGSRALFSPDGAYLAVAARPHVTLWRAGPR